MFPKSLLQTHRRNLFRRVHVEAVEVVALVDDLSITLHDVKDERPSDRLGHVADLQLRQCLKEKQLKKNSSNKHSDMHYDMHYEGTSCVERCVLILY